MLDNIIHSIAARDATRRAYKKGFVREFLSDAISVSVFLIFAAHVGNEAFRHQTGKNCHYHSVFEFYDIFRKCVDSGTNTTGHGESVFSISQILLKKKIIC